MALKIIIPERTHEEFGDSISRLLKVINLIISSTESEIELDFSQARMLNPFFLGGLVCSLKYFQSKGKKVSLNHDENFRINSYLERIFFPQCFSPEKDNETAFFNNWKSIMARLISQL